jgi:predicted glutamine amidotransferase
VYYGEIDVTVEGNDRNETHTFKVGKQTQNWTFTHNDDYEDNYIANPLKIRVHATVSSMYKLSVKSDEMSSRNTKLKMGLPTYIFLSPLTASCV